VTGVPTSFESRTSSHGGVSVTSSHGGVTVTSGVAEMPLPAFTLNQLNLSFKF
jgi:hypothetical protein